ncbi:biotin--protein ligase [Lysobacter arseniciresistens ZS79]|uniref:Bifunctional ligase/repressor BirA n=1 Tax=Lysobacter arseniciresistens ZS79 TaxID=913325 RepID=A0A0A0F0V5_9GAMM|nr:bifunctional biotin--[acetyl-CoA-carboxylase] ligase/biotin operon repressor BirA [Lysobacter arseniciresistens]KGM56374.1 biotin--protein ligase [Lysobacter arseniciresistens ZS79]
MDERSLLARLIEGPVSGDALARETGQTRASIWKRVEALREAGVPIEAQAGRGYALARPFDLLDSEAIAARLSPAVRARTAAVEVAWTIDSTNSELLRRPPAAGGQGGAATVLLAERQTGGRGRRGREWCSPLAAHLYLSLARGFGGGLARLGGLSLVAGIATVEALHALGFDSARLKWPNDIVIAGDDGLRKLGGLLVEGGGEHAGPVRAVVGLGLNVHMPEAFAARIDQPWCDLEGLAADGRPPLPSRNALAAVVIERWVPALDEFDAVGLAPFLPRYRAFDALAGSRVDVAGASGSVAGEVLGLADDGALRLRLDDGGERAFHAGEVSVRRAAGA